MTDTRTQTGGAICPLCRQAQDTGRPHLCITRPHLDIDLDDYGLDTPELRHTLLNHPARPITITDNGTAWLRTVDRTWCSCQCSTQPAVPDHQDHR